MSVNFDYDDLSDDELVHFVGSNLKLPEEELWYIARKDSDRIRSWVVTHPNTSAKLIEWLSCSPPNFQNTLSKIAIRHKTEANVLLKIWHLGQKNPDLDDFYKRSILRNTNLPIEILWYALYDKIPSIRSQASNILKSDETKYKNTLVYGLNTHDISVTDELPLSWLVQLVETLHDKPEE